MKSLGAILALLLLCSGTLKTDSTDLTVYNNTANELGVCTFSGGGNSVQLEVGPYANIDDPIAFAVDSVTIQGQSVVEPNSGPILLADGSEIGVQWTSTNNVEYYNWTKITTPVQ